MASPPKKPPPIRSGSLSKAPIRPPIPRSTPEEDKGSSFTVDTEKTMMMPSVTKLLNRKSLGLSAARSAPTPQRELPELDDQKTTLATSLPPSQDLSVTFEPQGNQEVHQVESSDSDAPSPVQTSPLEAPSAPKTDLDTPTTEPHQIGAPLQFAAAAPSSTSRETLTQSASGIHFLTPAELRAPKDPAALALAFGLKHGALVAIQARIQRPKKASKRVPSFLGICGYSRDPQRLKLLGNSIEWDPATSPDAWNRFLKLGAAVFPPQSQSRPRSVFRVASHESLVLVRVGTNQSCRGAVALIFSSVPGPLVLKLIAIASGRLAHQTKTRIPNVA